MASTAQTNKLLLQFRNRDSMVGVTRKTVKRMATMLGMNETETTQMALARLRDSLIPAYPEDNGPFTEKQLAAIRKLSPQAHYKPTRSLIEGL